MSVCLITSKDVKHGKFSIVPYICMRVYLLAFLVFLYYLYTFNIHSNKTYYIHPYVLYR